MKKLFTILFVLFFANINAQNIRKIEAYKIRLENAGDSVRLNLLSELAILHANDTIVAQNYIRQLLNLSEKIGSANGIALAYLSLGNIQSENFEHERALASLAKADSIYSLTSNNNGQARVLLDIGATNIKQGDNSAALDNFFIALKIFQVAHDTSNIMKVYNNIGYTHYRLGNSDSSILYYYKIIPYCTDNNDDVCFDMYNQLGIMYSEINEPKKAISFHKKSMAIKIANRDTLNMAMSSLNIAGVYFFQNQFDSCTYFLSQAMGLYKKSNNMQGEVICNNNLAAIYIEIGQFEKSIAPAKRARLLAEKIGDQFVWAGSFINLGGAYEKLGKYNLAEIYTDSALSIANRQNSKYLIQEYYGVKSRIMLGRKYFEKAYEYREIYHVYKDSILNENKTKQISALEVQYKIEKKEKEIELQASILREQNLTINRNIIIQIASIMAFVLILSLLYAFFNRRRLNQVAAFKQEKVALKEDQLAAIIDSQEKERSRFAKDLHDGFGQLISALRLNVNRLTEKNQLLITDVSTKSNEMLDEMYLSLKNIAFDLMPQTLVDKGISEALDELALHISNIGDIVVKVRSFKPSYGLSNTNKLSVYRIIQEVVNNIIKYADAKKIEISLTDLDNELSILVEDDGNGFDVDLLTSGRGNGWRNMQSRIDMIEGTIDFDSTPVRKGTTVSISIPFEAIKNQAA